MAKNLILCQRAVLSSDFHHELGNTNKRGGRRLISPDVMPKHKG